MFKPVLLSLFILISTISFSQIGVGPDNYFVNKKVMSFSEESLNRLKNSKTVFLYGKKDNPVELEKIIQSVWTYTEITLLPFEKFETIDFENTSIFSIEETHEEGVSICLQLWMQKTNRKGKKSKDSYCQILLESNLELSAALHDIRCCGKPITNKIFYECYYSTIWFNSLKNGFLKNRLQVVNQSLKDGLAVSPYEIVKDIPEVSQLASNTLYISKSIFITEPTAEELNEIFQKYSFEYAIVSDEVLNEKILDSKETIYYLLVINRKSKRFLSVVNSNTGVIVYSYVAMAFLKNLYAADIQKLNKIIESF